MMVAIRPGQLGEQDPADLLGLVVLRHTALRAVAADSAYGDQEGFRAELAEAGLPFVMALRLRRGTWARAADAHPRGCRPRAGLARAGPWLLYGLGCALLS